MTLVAGFLTTSSDTFDFVVLAAVLGAALAVVLAFGVLDAALVVVLAFGVLSSAVFRRCLSSRFSFWCF